MTDAAGVGAHNTPLDRIPECYRLIAGFAWQAMCGDHETEAWAIPKRIHRDTDWIQGRQRAWGEDPAKYRAERRSRERTESHPDIVENERVAVLKLKRLARSREHYAAKMRTRRIEELREQRENASRSRPLPRPQMLPLEHVFISPAPPSYSEHDMVLQLARGELCMLTPEEIRTFLRALSSEEYEVLAGRLFALVPEEGA